MAQKNTCFCWRGDVIQDFHAREARLLSYRLKRLAANNGKVLAILQAVDQIFLTVLDILRLRITYHKSVS